MGFAGDLCRAGDAPLTGARTLQARCLRTLSGVRAAQWDACFPPDYPFTRYDFLSALERSGSVGPDCGWTPSHLVLEAQGVVVAAAPVYLKSHSYGEFVFDFSWAQVCRQLRLRYYPKLLLAVPFTPVSGARLGARDASTRAALVAALQALTEEHGLSSAHALFLSGEEAQAFTSAGFMPRHDIQFHWHNPGYSDFAGFVAQLSHDKRKKILRERRRVREAGLRFERAHGETLSEAAWMEVYALYANTYHERGQQPYLTPEFFLDYGRAPGNPIRLISAFDGSRRVAVAMTWVSGTTLYGRHWGAAERYHSLHFETCYYQGIEWCIEAGLQRFDAGAQGEHKLARGFEPKPTQSAHWLAHPELHEAFAAAMARESEAVESHGEWLSERSPYRQDEDVRG